MEIKQIVEDAPKFLAEFYSITEQEAKDKIKIGWKLVKEEWEEYGVESAEFYTMIKNYPFDLAKFNSVRRVSFVKDVIDACVHEKVSYIENHWPDRKLKLLEYGGGGGEIALALSDDYDVTYLDLESTTFEYAKFRAEQYGANVRFCTEIPDEKFDVVSMQDVYEHIPAIHETMHSICDAMEPEGLFISSGYFFSTNHYLHLEQVETKREHMSVRFANDYALWLLLTFNDAGVKHKEPKIGMGAWRYKPEWNLHLATHTVLLAPEANVLNLENIDIVPNASEICKVNFMMTVL
jgi:SAM-dependent methyltransferase